MSTFTKALKVGGAGTAQVQSATLQMGQALASTNVQWEELGQILEASPRLARVFTDSLGVTRQQLKQMASDGKLTGEMLFNALNDRKITVGIDADRGSRRSHHTERTGSMTPHSIARWPAMKGEGE